MKQEIGDEIWEANEKMKILSHLELGKFSLIIWKTWVGISVYREDFGGSIFLGIFQFSYFKDN